MVWLELERLFFDLLLGVYKHRFRVLEDMNLRGLSVLDVGCGIGVYSQLFNNYVGIDTNPKIIRYLNHESSADKTFLLRDIFQIHHHSDVVLMVDVLHHLSDNICIETLDHAKKICDKLIIFDPLKDQKHFLAKLFIRLDRGKYIRNKSELHQIFKQVGFNDYCWKDIKLGCLNSCMVVI